ncbi:MAG TPA: DUF2318 domain-containing protein [Pyrinomonadaceae bacterium]|nr:DUF2318 domain-containing protein [Pyrinomonadaceae bacterium]
MNEELNAASPTSRESKRAQFEAGTTKKSTASRTTKILVVAAAVLLAAAAYLVAGSSDDPSAAAGGAGPLKASAAGDVTIPLSELSGKAKFYEYRTTAGKTVRFFALKSPDGAYRAALDACDVCFADKQGYSQEGEDMVCNKCGNHFHTSKINEVKGGCNPVGLTRTVEGRSLKLKAGDLEAGADYF